MLIRELTTEEYPSALTVSVLTWICRMELCVYVFLWREFDWKKLPRGVVSRLDTFIITASNSRSNLFVNVLLSSKSGFMVSWKCVSGHQANNSRLHFPSLFSLNVGDLVIVVSRWL